MTSSTSANDGARWRAGRTESSFARSLRGAGWVVASGRTVGILEEGSRCGGGFVDLPGGRRRLRATPEWGLSSGTSGSVFLCRIMPTMISRPVGGRKPCALQIRTVQELDRRDHR